VLPDVGKDERRGVIGVVVVVYTYGSVEDGELPPGTM
jgi:hypothetical protein